MGLPPPPRASASSAVDSLVAFPPASYLESAHVVAGLRACGLRSLEEPATFLWAAERVAAAAEAERLAAAEEGGKVAAAEEGVHHGQGQLQGQLQGHLQGQLRGVAEEPARTRRDQLAACGLALLKLLLARWSKLGAELQSRHLVTLRRAAFIPRS